VPGGGPTPARAGDRRRRPDRRHRDPRRDVVTKVLATGGPHVEFQPLLSLTRLEVAGYEALARFPAPAAGERRQAARPGGTEEWLAVGHDVGLGPQVEAAAVARAVLLGAGRPAGTVLAVNLSPSSLGSPHVLDALPDDLTGLEIELTEQEAVENVADLRRRLAPLRERGARIAVDDVGAGYAGLSRVVDLAPDTVKIDKHLVEGVATNGARAALVRAVVHLADHVGARVCAEGVETAADLVALAELDVSTAQGWFVGRPAPRPGDVEPEAVEACRAGIERLFSGPPPHDSVRTLTDLLGRLGDVRSRDDLRGLVAAAASVLGCSAVVLGACAPGLVRLAPVVGTDPTADEVLGLSERPGVRERLLGGAAVPVYDGRTAPDDGPAPPRAAVLVPVRSRGDVVGVLACTLRAGAPWSRRQISGARLLASALGPVLDALHSA
jgi:EAL domain-containing protein (putative c-di-GMP-specific phosphodiesterase class I)